MIAISVDLAIDGWSLDRILRERMWSRSTFTTTTVGQLRAAGYEMVATNAADEHDPVFAKVHALTQHADGPVVVHLELLSGDPLDYADALRRAHLLTA